MRIMDKNHTETRWCQSCAMPMDGGDAVHGTNADGTMSEDYCSYCYQNGAFTTSCTMNEMVEMCVPHLVQAHPDMTEQSAREMMLGFFPTLKRWQQ